MIICMECRTDDQKLVYFVVFKETLYITLETRFTIQNGVYVEKNMLLTIQGLVISQE